MIKTDIDMQITINDCPAVCPESFSISDLLVREGIEPVNIAVAMDDVVIPKRQWNTVYLKQNSHIIIIRAVQGG